VGPAPEVDAPTITPAPTVSAPSAAISSQPQPATSAPVFAAAPEPSLRMKPRDTVQLAAVHVRIPEQLARGLRLMAVLENRQAQVIVAEMLEERLNLWNPNWRQSVPARDG
jgi:hypothetical protein